LNKYDVVGNEGANTAFDHGSVELPNAKIFPVSALHKLQIDLLLKQIIQVLPESPAYFPKDELSDKSVRFFASEIIREKIFLNYSKEIPYSTEVVIEAFRDEPDIVHMNALIVTERESQKAIIIGHQGKMLKKIGTEARKDIESFLQKKVMLTTHVKVDDNWRNDSRRLKGYGYLEE
jgi:GTPase